MSSNLRSAHCPVKRETSRDMFSITPRRGMDIAFGRGPRPDIRPVSPKFAVARGILARFFHVRKRGAKVQWKGGPGCRFGSLDSMRTFLLALLTGALALGLSSVAPAQQVKGTIELEILFAPGFSPIEAQKWGQMLEGIPVENLTMRSGNAGEMEKLDNYGTAERPLYKIKGILTDRGELMVP